MQGLTHAKRFRLILLGVYLLWWMVWAIAPYDRHDWLLENLLVVAALPLVIRWHRLFSNSALAALFVFSCLHTLGSHYTYSQVPYDAWSEQVFGYSVSSYCGGTRNHFDRLVHFLYGVLVTPVVVQLLDARVPQRGIWRWLIPLTFMASHAGLYEVIEWLAAASVGGELGQAFLGTQGDEWDAQKDMALAILGSLLVMPILRWRPPEAPHQASSL